jgi:hypothetical protein
VAGEARTVHVVQEATPRGQGNDRLRIGRRDVLARASWIAVLVSGWGLIAWGLLYLAAVDVAIGVGAPEDTAALSVWMVLAPLGFACVVTGTMASVPGTGHRWSAPSVAAASAVGWLAAGIYGALTVAPLAVFAAAVAAQWMPRVTAPWRVRYGPLAAGCAWAAGLPLAVTLLLSDDPGGGHLSLLLSPPPLTAGFTVGWTVAAAALLYFAAVANDCPRLVTLLSAGACAAGGALTFALVDINGLDIPVAFLLGVLPDFRSSRAHGRARRGVIASRGAGSRRLC